MSVYDFLPPAFRHKRVSATASTSPPTPVRVGGGSIPSLPSGSWRHRESSCGGRLTLSQNTTTIAPTSEGWVFAYLRAKSPVARLYEAYKAILRVGLVAAALVMTLFAKYSRMGRFKID